MVRILGIDPGLATCGLARMKIWHAATGQPTASEIHAHTFVTESQVRKQNVHASHDAMKRAGDLATCLDAWMSEVDLVVYEGISMPRHASSAGKLCIAFGVIAAMLHKYRLPALQVSPQELAKFFGAVRGGKDPRVAWVNERYPDALAAIKKDKQDHAADAIGLCHVVTNDSLFLMLDRQEQIRRGA